MTVRDYRLNGESTRVALARGLADAQWYRSPVPKAQMRQLLQRRNGPAVRDTAIWFALLGLTGFAMAQTWGSGWFILFFAVYAVLYASVSDSRWHECSHGTAFRTDWLNSALYEISSFLVFRESTTWRWSHVRHHTDTIIVGRDPEIASPRPVRVFNTLMGAVKVHAMVAEGRRIVLHAFGQRTEDAREFVPEYEWPKIHWKARVYLAIYLAVVLAAIITQSWLPLFFVGLPTIAGSWLIAIYGYTQHAGLAEDVLDHRLNSRTVHMNWLNRYLYWNMNYHVEHHMFPLVPYHALPRLHQLIKDDCPPAYKGLWAAWKEIIPALWRQSRDADYFVRRPLPASSGNVIASDSGDDKVRPVIGAEPAAELVIRPSGEASADGWVSLGDPAQLLPEDVVRVDYDGRTFAVYRTADTQLFATEGMCTHGNAHLAEGFVKGRIIECPKHNGRFDISTGAAVRGPACSPLQRFDVRIQQGQLQLCIHALSDAESGKPAAAPVPLPFRVVAKRQIASFICELELAPLVAEPKFTYRPGDFIQLIIPRYESRKLVPEQIDSRFVSLWQSLGIFDIAVENPLQCKRNYSLATNPQRDNTIKLNVRLALGQVNGAAALGVGSSYVFGLEPGDIVEAMGPQGSFRIKPTEAEMIYLGGGAGMAPLRSHISYLLESEQSQRKISFWYGARSASELIYADYFRDLSARYPNFSFHVAVSDVPAEAAAEASLPTGFIHEHLYRSYLQSHADLSCAEFYLCGPPPMMAATRRMLAELKVSDTQVAFDEF